MKAPAGFRFSGVHAGIKPNRRDLALVFSDRPCSAAGCFTTNKSKAAPVLDAEPRLPSDKVRAVIINSGNANALTGPAGLQDVKSVLDATGRALGIPGDAVVSASTGVIGQPLPTQKIISAIPALAQGLRPEPEAAAEAILTTDTRIKMASRMVSIAGKEVSLAGICKGSGMIAPELATMIAVIVTDCRNAPISEADRSLATFSAALSDLCQQLAKEVAADGEGATKLLEVTVSGLPSDEIARDLARAVAGSNLVKAAVFGADPNWGRMLSAAGARAGSQRYPVDPNRAQVRVQGVNVYSGEPLNYDAASLRAKMREPEVRVELDFL